VAPPSRRQGLLLGGTLAAAVAVTAGMSGLVLAFDPAAGLSEALRTGGVAGASVVALYALWLNDRRRRTEEARQGVEEERLRLEGDRTTNERFARSIEMLGNEADQVRLGAVHALVGLARATPSYAQTVVDVLCAYLRRPFFHRAYERDDLPLDRSDFADPTRVRVSDAEGAEDRERQVRLTAQRALRELLPPRGADGPVLSLDLTGASLEYLDLEERLIGALIARRAVFNGITRLSSTHFTGRVLLTGSVFRWRLEMGGVRFDGGVSLREARLLGHLDLTGCTFADFADLRWHAADEANLSGSEATSSASLELPSGVDIPRRTG
jgi:pentapeptide repeat protein